MTLHGTGVSPGIGIGRIVLLREGNLDYSSVSFAGEAAEKARLADARAQFTEATRQMAQTMSENAGQKEAEILLGQITMLDDPFLREQMEEQIGSGACAEAAVDAVCTMYIDMFSGMEDELMRQRAADVRDIRRRMLQLLLGVSDIRPADLPAGSILAAHDLTPSMTVGITRERIAGILTETGGRTSHSAILARSLEIPAVLGVEHLLERVLPDSVVALDGDTGTAVISPDESVLEEYRAKQEQWNAQRARLFAYRDKPTLDADGNRFHLYANIGNPADARAALEAGAEGIGLFRTEFLFMDRAGLPTEDEQVEAYREVSELMTGKEVIIRTLDVGGDKEIAYLGMEKEENPFLGHRAIRYCLERQDVFSTQLRALLRAGAKHKNIKIMLPLVTSMEEVRMTRSLLEQCKTELTKQGKEYDGDISLGVMIETPAASLIAGSLAKECDFFSIGTNDLTQYTLAVDRGNPKVEPLYTPFHPAVLHSIQHIIMQAKKAGIPVGMCGEAAADPRMIPLLLAFGLDEFSVSPSSVLAARHAISCWDTANAAHTADEAMRLCDSASIQNYLQTASHQQIAASKS